MKDPFRTLIVSALFVILTLYIISTAFYSVFNFDVQAKKHSRMANNNDVISSSNKEKIHTGAPLSNTAIGGENSFVATNTMQGEHY